MAEDTPIPTPVAPIAPKPVVKPAVIAIPHGRPADAPLTPEEIDGLNDEFVQHTHDELQAHADLKKAINDKDDAERRIRQHKENGEKLRARLAATHK
jgi:hypothetical protein